MQEMDRREKNSNQLNVAKNTTTNMKVNTQEVSHEEQQPLQPAQSTQGQTTQTMQQTSSSEQLQEKKYELADYQPIEHILII